MSGGARQAGLEVSVRSLDGSMIGRDAQHLDYLITDTTDGAGTIAVYVQYGYRAGINRFELSAPSIALVDTVELTVLPGNAVQVMALPTDTSVYVNSHVNVRSHTADQFGNPREDALTYTTSGNLGALAAGRASVGGIARGYVVSRFGAWVDTAWVSVVPRARLIVAHVHADGPVPGWYVVETDGTIIERIATLGGEEAVGSVSPDGSRFVYQYGSTYSSRLFDYRFATRTTTELFANTLNAGWPEFTRDGAWIVYHMAESPSTGGGALYRVPASGGTPERLPTGSGDYFHDVTPSSSPDGARIVYASNRGTYPAYYLKTIEVATGTMQNLIADGYSPKWSPQGDLIAFPSNTSPALIRVIRPDGTGARTLTPAGVNYAAGVTWSDDGEWIVATRTGERTFLDLIAADGSLILPLHPGGLSPRKPIWLSES